ncbi:peptidoglycan-binding protein [Naumannella huperziae]
MTAPTTPRRLGRRIFAGLGAAALSTGVLLGGLSTAPTATAAPAPAEQTAASTDIRTAQINLRGLDYYHDAVDGENGTNTLAAVRAFQTDACIEVDGSYGPQTAAAVSAKIKQVQARVGIDQDGSYGTATTEAVRKYQTAKGLKADGIAGPETMRSMGISRTDCEAPTTDERAKKILALAEQQVGIVAGPDAQKFFYGEWSHLDTTNRETGNWCAGFVSWVTSKQLGLHPYNMVGVRHYRAKAEANDEMSFVGQARPGDFAVYDWDNNGVWDHIGIVKTVNGASFTTIEGNTSGPKAKSQVAERNRGTDQGYDVEFIRLK